MRANFIAWTAAAMLVIAALASHAQTRDAEAVQTTLEARKVTRGADGREALVSADSARPGDVIEYAATYRNVSREPIRKLEPTLPIPGHTEYVPESQRPRNVRASLDARDFGAIPLKRKAVRNGRQVEEDVPYRDYRYLRWAPVDLGPNAIMTFTARVRILE
jgi:hypothetical protein